MKKKYIDLEPDDIILSGDEVKGVYTSTKWKRPIAAIGKPASKFPNLKFRRKIISIKELLNKVKLS